MTTAQQHDTDAVSLSGYIIDPLYNPKNGDIDPNIGLPGQFPYTRGVHETMYRSRLWTMRQFAGFGSAEDTNARFKYLLKNAKGTKTNTGLSTAFDLPTLMGRDSNDPLSAGEVGRCGVAIDTIDDMHRLYDDIPIGEVTVSQTINGPACVIWAMYLAMAKERNIDWDTLGGTLQNDILKEFHSQNEFIYPPEASVKLVVDTIEFATNNTKRWNSISISGYHIREAGSTATQELAFTLRDGMEYVEACIARGLDVDSFAPRLSFFFNSHNEFFEEICKLRAARRIWAHAMRDRYGAKNERSWLMRTHVQTAGCTLTEQQPLNNIVRVAFQAMAGVLGGCQSLHTDSMDETLGGSSIFSSYSYSEGDTVITDCVFRDNDTSAGSSGGLIVENERDGHFNMQGCLFESNRSEYQLKVGSNTFNDASIEVSDSVFKNNMGSGIIVDGWVTTMNIENSTVKGNSVGGISSWSGSVDHWEVTITNTTVCSNEEYQIDNDDWIDGGGNTVTEVCFNDCQAADITDDGIVDISDILAILGYWGSSIPAGDVDGNGVVDIGDLLMVVGNWGPCE